MSTKGRLVRLLAGAVIKHATIATTEEIGGFQRLLVQCDVEKFPAGTKVQLLLPSNDMRTYTPIPTPDGMVLLACKHTSGPGAHWMSNAQVGDEVLFIGPQHSLELDAGSVILIGDETSVAVAAAFANEKPEHIHVIIQTDATDDVRAAAKSVGLQEVDIVACGDTDATVALVTDKLKSSPNIPVVITGGSDLVIGVRAGLRHAGVQNIKVKTYWVPGKTGLD